MPKLADLLFRVRTLLRLGHAERELNEEFEFHLAMERDKLIARGHSAADADALARQRFGGLTRERQRTRDEWGIGLVRDLASDVRHALRQFRRRPAFSVLGTLTLALGIGATVSLFSVVQGALLRPLPVPHEERLRVFWSPFDWRGVEIDHIKTVPRAMEGVAAYTINSHTLASSDGNTMGLGGLVTADFFDVIGRAPLLGATFAAGDDRPGAEPKVVISWGLWQRELGGDPDVLGTRITVDGAPFTVIGVMPRDFYFPTPTLELWRTLDMDPADDAYNGNGWLVAVARARPGASEAELDADIRAIATSLGERFEYPEAWDKTRNPSAVTLREYLMGDVRPTLLLLLGAVVALLLMACANVAALVLSRTTDRAPEMSLRTALGAGRGRLIRQIVAESLAMAMIAGTLGVVLSIATYGALLRSLPFGNDLASTFGIEWPMFAAAFGISVFVTLLVAFAPVRGLLRGVLRGVSGERSTAGLRGGQRRFHAAMVTTEIGLGVLLVAGALLLVRSVANLYARDTGFGTEHVVSVGVVTPPQAMDSESRRQFFLELASRAHALPGVQSAGFVSRIPVRDGGGQGPVRAQSRTDLTPATLPNSVGRVVTPGYFDAMDIRIVRGRGFTDADRLGTQVVTVVSESFAEEMWPGQDPLGERVAGAGLPMGAWMTVIGVAEEVRLFSVEGPNPMALYVSLAQLPQMWEGFHLIAHTRGSDATVVAQVRDLVRATDRRAAIGPVTTMDAVVATSLANRLQLRFFLSLFAALALVLGAIGVYGVVSYAVTRRRAEFGVRMALGATSGTVLRQVAVDGLRPVVLGVALGLAAAVVLSRSVAGFLFEVQPADPLSLGAAGAALLLAGVIAVIVPGWRAGRTSPVEVLRGD